MKKILGLSLLLIGLFSLAACDRIADDTVEVTLTSDVEAAELSITPEQPVDAGSEVTIEASEIEGHEFEHWYHVEAQAVFTENRTHTFEVNEDMTLEAVYSELDAITIELTSDLAEAELSILPDTTIYVGTEVTISASEPEDYVFEHWLDTETGEIFAETREYVFTADEDLTLAAVYIDAAVYAAEQTMNAFEGDVGHLEGFLNALEDSDAFGFELHFLVEEPSRDGTDTQIFEIHMEYNVLIADSHLSEFIVHVDPPMEDETFSFHIVIEETDHYYEVYLDIGMLLDAMAEDDDVDFRELFALDSDYVYIAFPKDADNGMFDALIEEFEDALAEEGLAIEDIEYVLDNLDRFEKYLSMEYWNTHEHLETAAEIIDETHIKTTIIINPEFMVDVFEDLFEDVYTLIKEANPDELPPYEEFIDSEEYQAMLDELGDLDPFEITLVHEPYTNNALSLEFDLLDLIGQLEDEGLPSRAELNVTFRTYADVETIDEARDILDIGEEVLQLLIMMESVQYAANIIEDPEIAAGTYTINELETMGHHLVNPLLDREQSTVEVIEDNDERNVILDFIYEVNGEPIFVEPLNFMVLIDDDALPEDEPQTREDLLAIIAYTDEDNINMYAKAPILIEFLLTMEEPPNDEPHFPEEDLEGEDFDQLARYPDSVILYADSHNGTDILYYAVQNTTMESVNNHFINYIEDANDFVINDVEETEDGFVIMASYTGETNYEFSIEIMPSDEFENAIDILIYRADPEQV